MHTSERKARGNLAGDVRSCTPPYRPEPAEAAGKMLRLGVSWLGASLKLGLSGLDRRTSDLEAPYFRLGAPYFCRRSPVLPVWSSVLLPQKPHTSDLELGISAVDLRASTKKLGQGLRGSRGPTVWATMCRPTCGARLD